MQPNKDKLFTAKVDEATLSAFKHACESQDTTASQAVRRFMKDYINKHGQLDMFAPTKTKKGR
jgi:hypothetical protein